MARPKAPGNGGSSGKPVGNTGWKGSIEFISVALSDAQKSAYGHWEASSPDVSYILDECLTGGYKISLGYDEKSSSYMGTLTNRSGDPAFVDKCFTLRARSAWQALTRVLWLHAVYAAGDWSEFANPSDSADIW